MKSCKGCVYEDDMKRLKEEGYITWSSSEPHPCAYCIRYEELKKVLTDNYLKKGK